MSEQITVKIYITSQEILREVQERLPGKPTQISLLDMAIKLLAEKYLKKES